MGGPTILLDELSHYLVTQSVGSGSATADWFVAKSYEPETPDKVITLIETGGFPNERPDIPLDRPTFQLRVRGAPKDYAAARIKIGAARTALELVNNTSIGSPPWKYIYLFAAAEPLNLGYDANLRPTLVMNLVAGRSRT